MLQTQPAGGNSQKQADDAGKRQQREEIQRKIIILEADYKKELAQKFKLDAEIRKLKKDEIMLRVDERKEQEEIGRIDQDVRMIENEIKNLKKKLNSL